MSVGCLCCLSFSRAMRGAYLWDKRTRTPTFFIMPTPEVTTNSRIWGVCTALFTTMKPIGLLIKEELEKQERSITWFANKLSCDRSNIYRLFQKESIDTQLLARISILLGRDFFADLSKYIKEKEKSQDSQ